MVRFGLVFYLEVINKSNSTEIILLDSAAFNELVNSISEKVLEGLKTTDTESLDYWFNNEDLCRYLKISKRQLQKYRDQNLIRYRQIGAKIWYKSEWVQEFLEGGN